MQRYINFHDLVKLERILQEQHSTYKEFTYKTLQDEYGNALGFKVYAIPSGKKEPRLLFPMTFSDIRYAVTNTVTPIYDSPNICGIS